MNSEFVIVGDTEKYEGCLIYTCFTKENAEETLYKMLNNPDENDLRVMKGHKNIRIKEVKAENCWWNRGTN